MRLTSSVSSTSKSASVARLHADKLLTTADSTDNGYHIGQHRLQPGKQCAYREDINIPFLVRGPGVPRRHTSHIVTSHTDLAATFLKIAGAKERRDLDGEVIPLTLAGMLEAEPGVGIGDDEAVVSRRRRVRQEHVSVEMWGIIMSEGKFGNELHHNHTYKALRVVGEGYDLRYTVWCGGERELYDLKVWFVFLSFPISLGLLRRFSSLAKKGEEREKERERDLEIRRSMLTKRRTDRPPRTHKHLPHHGSRPNLLALNDHPCFTTNPTNLQPDLPPRRPPRRPQNLQSQAMHPPLGSLAPSQQRRSQYHRRLGPNSPRSSGSEV